MQIKGTVTAVSRKDKTLRIDIKCDGGSNTFIEINDAFSSVVSCTEKNVPISELSIGKRIVVTL